MITIKKKAVFEPNKNRMSNVGDVNYARNDFLKNKNKNLHFLLNNRFKWMYKFFNENEHGLEVGAGAGFSKFFIKNKNFEISDLAEYKHLDLKNIDAQNTGLEANKYDFIIASNMIHHVAYPIKFLNEMHRILKPGGRLIVQDANCSILFQIITLIMKHEGYDFTKDVWKEDEPMSNENDTWSGNIAITNLIFDDLNNFSKKFNNKFIIQHYKNYECLIFLNSGGVTSKTFYIPLNNMLLNFINIIDNILTKFFPKIFALGKQIVLKKV